MPSAKLVLGSAGAATVVGIKLARTLHSRWGRLPSADRERIAPLAEDAKRKALELRGADDLEVAARELRAANETLAAALVESAEGDPELDAIEVKRLREDLRRELERLASGEVRASRSARSR
jgi:hypothetical protein